MRPQMRPWCAVGCSACPRSRPTTTSSTGASGASPRTWPCSAPTPTTLRARALSSPLWIHAAVVSPAPIRTQIRVVDDSLPADHDRPARLLERHSEHRRAETLAALAANPHTPHAAVTDVLGVLHPAELAWIAEKIDGPDWFLKAAAAVPAPEDEDDGVLRLLSDDELALHPDPAAVLQSWLDSPAIDENLSRSEVYRALVKSRHHTLEHLRQIPADEVLTRHEPEITLEILLEHCGRSTDRWAALAAAMTFEYDEAKITFGELLDSLDGKPTEAQAS